MVSNPQMHQFMQDHILKALDWFLCKLQIQPNLPCGSIAGAPLGSHVLTLPAAALQPGNPFPFGQVLFDLRLQQGCVPFVYKSLPLFYGAFFPNGQNRIVSRKYKGVALVAMLNTEKILSSPNIECLSRYILPLTLQG